MEGRLWSWACDINPNHVSSMWINPVIILAWQKHLLPKQIKTLPLHHHHHHSPLSLSSFSLLIVINDWLPFTSTWSPPHHQSYKLWMHDSRQITTKLIVIMEPHKLYSRVGKIIIFDLTFPNPTKLTLTPHKLMLELLIMTYPASLILTFAYALGFFFINEYITVSLLPNAN